jgi:hypothetical protein
MFPNNFEHDNLKKDEKKIHNYLAVSDTLYYLRPRKQKLYISYGRKRLFKIGA